MALAGLPKYLVIDDFLPKPLLGELLDFALTNQHEFQPALVIRDHQSVMNPQVRQSSECDIGLGPHKAAFEQTMLARSQDILAALAIPPFAIDSAELQLIAHGDKAFYKSHIDTLYGPDAASKKSIRVVSCVFYFHREPKRFTGGEIALEAIGNSDERVLIEPRQNRLLAFPSIVRHEVLPIACPSGQFGDSRFAINCWLRKARSKPLGQPDD